MHKLACVASVPCGFGAKNEEGESKTTRKMVRSFFGPKLIQTETLAQRRLHIGLFNTTEIGVKFTYIALYSKIAEAYIGTGKRLLCVWLGFSV